MNNIKIVIEAIIIYFFVINLVTFFMMWYDKRRAINNKWRVKESTLFILALIGGEIGGMIGMKKFHHKTQKNYFKYGFPAIFIFHICIIIYIIIEIKT